MYFQRSLVVATTVSDANDRAAFFATVYSASALLTILLQISATGKSEEQWFMGIYKERQSE